MPVSRWCYPASVLRAACGGTTRHDVLCVASRLRTARALVGTGSSDGDANRLPSNSRPCYVALSTAPSSNPGRAFSADAVARMRTYPLEGSFFQIVCGAALTADDTYTGAASFWQRHSCFLHFTLKMTVRGWATDM
ncbi:hypothetical protein C8Q73DRAFT_693751, partial [Cubamyces lactineus]